ncbi:ABC transporter permease [Streptomyces sp. NPDC002790]|uniref:ABC transporter permease n=1 Tax=Streptomyces sp. NPDC002790 TaxID=3154431 RepID=UPI003331D62F
MGRYVIRRLLQMIPVFIGTTLLIFLMVNVMGDPTAALCGDKACDPATQAALREQFHLDKPLVQQYLIYLGNIFQGDFGTAFNGDSVADLMLRAYPVTIKLTFVAIVFEIVIGIGLGVITGLRRGKPIDTGVLVLTLVVISVPTFVTGLVAQLLFGMEWGIVKPSVAYEAPLSELILPGLVLASVSLAYVTRLTRTSVADNARSDYVRTAVAKGLPRRRIIWRHLLRNSLIPVVTFIGTDIGALMGGAIVTERIFNIRGVGYQLYQGILHQSSPTVVGFVTVLVIVFLLANLIVDLLYAVLDPRIRYA